LEEKVLVELWIEEVIVGVVGSGGGGDDYRSHRRRE
jgi:hypothetical protein